MTASSFGGKPFTALSAVEKSTFVVKLFAFICTFGFAYPTILHSDEYVKKYQ